MILRKTQFSGGTQHAKRFNTAHLDLADFHAARQFGAQSGKRHLEARRRVGCATHDLQQCAGAVINLTDPQFVSVGMWRNFGNVTHDNAAERRRHGLGFFNLKARHGQLVRQRFGAQIGVGE